MVSIRLTLLEYLRSHVLQNPMNSSETNQKKKVGGTYPRCPTDLCQLVQLLLFHNPAQPEIGNHNISLLRLSAEQQVFRFQI